MRIVQLIDSLEAGGAERVAVNYANTLSNKIEFSGLVATRKEGPLLHQIGKGVSYMFLDKKRKLDLRALFKFRSFVLKNRVTHIHAHSSSFFFAFLLKLTCPSLLIIWHDHFGNNEFLINRPHAVLRVTVPFFKGVIAVNQNLKEWSLKQLKAKNVTYLPNFPSKGNNVENQTILAGVDGKRIVSLANLRRQKDHFLLLDVAKEVKKSYPDWTFHLVGKDFEDEYSDQIQKAIKENGLEENLFLYGSKPDIENMLNQSSIAILTSKSEGLPVALLEYGMYKKAVVVTEVGEIPRIIQHGINGFIVEAGRVDLFYQCLVDLIENEPLRTNFGNTFFDTIQREYTEEGVINRYLKWLQVS